jgi:hypothetical protein
MIQVVTHLSLRYELQRRRDVTREISSATCLATALPRCELQDKISRFPHDSSSSNSTTKQPLSVYRKYHIKVFYSNVYSSYIILT